MELLVAVKDALVLLAVVLLNSLTFVGHSTAMSTMSHEMSGINHSSSNASSCATLCRTAVVNKDENVIKNDENEDDNEPELPFYIQNQPLQIDSKSMVQRLYVTEIKPPPKVPIYILYGIFRA